MARRFKPLLTSVRQYGNRWGFCDYFSTGKRKQIRRLTKGQAQAEHTRLSVLIANGRKDLVNIDPVELAQFRGWKLKRSTSATCSDIRERFIASKRADPELNPGYVANLALFTKWFTDELGGSQIGQVTAPQIRQFLDYVDKAPRHRNNIRDAIAAMFAFAREEGELPEGKTEAEKVKRLKIRRAPTITLWSPEQFRKILFNARPKFQRFYAISGFAGIRSEEIRPKAGSPKDPLRFDDFHWRDGYINVRDETAKTGIGRHVPITPALRSFMEADRNKTGVVLDVSPISEMQRLAKLLGIEHKKNGARHSFGTYYQAVNKDILKLVEIMGTSIPIARSRYIRNVPVKIARKWFAIRAPKQARNIIRMPRQKKVAC